MGQSYVVQPVKRHLSGILGGIEEIPLSHAARHFIESAYIREVLVHVEERSWTLTLYTPKLVPAEVQQEVTDVVQKAIGAVSQVDLRFISRADLAPPAERLAQLWPKIYKRLREELPAAIGC